MGKVVLELKNVSLIKKQKHILRNLNWQVIQNEHWVILGSNGSGKTMMLKMLAGYLFPSRGEIICLGEKFGATDINELRKMIGWVSFDLQNKMQDTTAFEVVLSGFYASIGLYKKPGEEVLKKAQKLIKFIGCEKVKNNLFPTLSYGEQKKILIARSLIGKPKLLLLDEPCSGLDLKARKEFLFFIDRIAKKSNDPAIIFVTHHIEEIVPSITHILALKKGQIIAKGKKKDILKKNLTKKLYE